MKNFYIVFYGFHLYRNFSDNLSEVSEDAQSLWESLTNLGNTLLPFKGLKELKSNLIFYEGNDYRPDPELEIEEELLTKDSKQLKLGTISPIANLTIRGTLSPYRLNDVYAVGINLSAESPADTEISPSQLKYFNPQDSLLASDNSNFLGRTIWIYAEVDDDSNCKQIAEDCIKALLAETQPQIKLENNSDLYAGELFGSSLFEFKTNYPESTKQYHILVSLNNSKSKTLNQLRRAKPDLFYLLCSYHKILYVNQQAKVLYQEIRKQYSNLNKEFLKSPEKIKSILEEIKNILAEENPEKFKKLEEILLDTYQRNLEYTSTISSLRSQYTAIKTNIINYKTALENITDIENQPHLWKSFVNLVEENWQQQIKIDIEYFEPGEKLFQRVIDVISGFLQIKQAEYDRASRELLIKSESEQQERNRILLTTEAEQRERDRVAQNLLITRENEQKKRDRQLENTVQSLGIAIAVGSSTAGILASTYQVSPNFAKNILQIKVKDDDGTFQNTQVLGFSFATSIVVGVAFGFAALRFTKWILDRQDRRRLRKQQEQEQISS